MDFFNNNTTQLAIVAFMDWFSKLSIEKYQTVTVSGEDYYAQRKVIPVPICWATREKMVEILRSSSSRKAMNPTDRDKNPVEMQWILPRISVNMSGTTYDPSRRLIKTQQQSEVRNSVTSMTSTYTPTPYNVALEVSTISKNIDENFQLMEQIIPFFSPAMSMNLNLIPNNPAESVTIVLDSVSVDNPVDIMENDERLFTMTYTFTMKLNYRVHKRTGKIINNIDIGIGVGVDVIKIEKTYVEAMNLIQNKFTEYVNNTNNANPFLIPKISNDLVI